MSRHSYWLGLAGFCFCWIAVALLLTLSALRLV